MQAKIGEIWLVTIPILEFDENGDMTVRQQKRPCLILDDGRGLIVEEDHKNFHVLKLTTQYDKYKRKLIKDWKNLGLAKKSYIRIEMPIKIEKAQFDRKITKISEEELLEVYHEIYEIINVNALKNFQKKQKKNKRCNIISLVFFMCRKY